MIFNTVEELVAFVNEKEIKIPDWQRQLFSKYRSEIQVHSKGELFYKIDRLFPNEAPVSKEHRVLSFESVTKGSFHKGVNNVQQIFQNSSYSVEASEKTIQFITKHNFQQQNLFTFFLEKWCEAALSNDPNSLIVVYPFEYMKRGKNFPQVLFIPSEHILHQDHESVIFTSEEESEKDYELQVKEVQTKLVYDNTIDRPNIVESVKNTFAPKIEIKFKKKVIHCFSLNSFYALTETDDPKVFDFYFFKHNKNFLPCIKAGGRDNGKGIYESFFSVFCPFGNLALLQHSQHTAVNFTFSFPRMSEIEIPCDAIGCNSGWVTCEISSAFPEGKKRCAMCVDGYRTNQSPYKVYKKRLEPNTMTEDVARAVLAADDVKFYTPDTTILDYSKNEWKDYLESAEAAVYVSQKVKTGNVESEGSKEKDHEDRYNFLRPISKVFFSRLRAVVQFFENYINNSPAEVTIEEPSSFAIVPEGQAFEELQTILDSDAPVVIKANRVEAFMNKYVSSSSPIKKAFSILKRVDPLLFYSDAQIQAQKASNIITAKHWAIHVFAYPILSKMFEDQKGLFDADERTIESKLLKELEPLIPETADLKTKLQQSLNNEE